MKQSSFNFINPNITKVQFEKNNKFNFSKDLGNIEMQNELNVSILSQNDNNAVVQLIVSINKNNFETSPFKLEVAIQSKFTWTTTEYDVDTLLKQNAPALLLSYVRPIISVLTSSASLPNYYLPFVDFTK